MPTKNPIFLIFEVEYFTLFTKMSNLKGFQHLKRVTLTYFKINLLVVTYSHAFQFNLRHEYPKGSSVPHSSTGIKPLSVTRIFSTGGWEFAHHGDT